MLQYHACATSGHVDGEGRRLVPDKREEPAADRSGNFQGCPRAGGSPTPSALPAGYQSFRELRLEMLHSAPSRVHLAFEHLIRRRQSHRGLELPCIMLQLATSSEMLMIPVFSYPLLQPYDIWRVDFAYIS